MSFKEKFLSRARIGFLALPLVLAACESEEERAERMQKVADMVTTSLETCDLQSESITQADYEAKLSDVLDGLSYNSLSYFENQDIVFCLDTRMADIGYYSRRNRPIAIYHPEERVMALNTDRLNYATSLVSRFAGSYDADDLNALDDVQMAVRYKSGSTTKRRWRDGGSEYSAIEDNPELLEPPINSID